jgi:formamidopyrimidine-DNA glycosylase
MPELPEMETYRLLLERKLAGRTIRRASVQREKSVNLDPRAFEAAVVSRTVTGLSRRGKHLLFHLSDGNVLLLHLMLGGLMFFGTEREKPARTVQVTLSVDEGNLYFIGLRLGYLHLLAEQEAQAKLSRLGPEPLAPEFTPDVLKSRLASKSAAVKQALTDQQTIAGIGNCYADEICFAAGVLPHRKIPSLNGKEYAALYTAIQDVLQEAVRYGGYMEMPLFEGDHLTGGFDSRCRIYDRGGEPCVRCGALIVQEELSSRKMFYCPHCQR